MEQARVAPHPRRDRQGLGLVLPAPQHHRVERALVQVVEGGIGGERAHHLGPGAGQGVGQGEELRRRLPYRQHTVGTVGLVRQLQTLAALGECLEPQLEFLFGDRRAHQRVEAQRQLGRIDRGGQHQVEGVALLAGIRLADGDDRQAARRAGRLQPPREGDGVLAGALGVDDGGFEGEVGVGGEGGVRTASGDRTPPKVVQAAGKRLSQVVVPGDDQNAGVHGHFLIRRRKTDSQVAP